MKEKEEETIGEASIRMAGAIETALLSAKGGGDRRYWYSDLTDNQLYGFHEALWGYTQDLQDEWVRREMLKRAKELA